MKDKKKSLGIFTTYMDRRPGKGTALFAHRLVEGLMRYEDDFDITLIHREKIPEDSLYQNFKEVILPNVWIPKKKLFFSELLFFIQTWFRKDLRFDILFFPYSRLHPLFWICSAKKIIFTPMDGGPQTAGFMVKNYGKPLRVANWFQWRINFFIALTEFGRQGIIDTLGVSGDKVKIVPCGIDQNFFDRKVNVSGIEKYDLPKKYILSVSRFDPHKNILNMLHAYDLLVREYGCEEDLVFVGGAHSPDYSREVTLLINTLGLGNRVHICSFIDDNLMPAVYMRASVMLFPSYYEGFGMPVAEAMAVGLPVVGSDRGSLPEVIGDGGICVDPDDVPAIAKAVNKILTDDDFRMSIIQKGFKRAQGYTWENAVSALVRTFK